jgi:hypothetical protein
MTTQEFVEKCEARRRELDRLEYRFAEQEYRRYMAAWWVAMGSVIILGVTCLVRMLN